MKINLKFFNINPNLISIFISFFLFVVAIVLTKSITIQGISFLIFLLILLTFFFKDRLILIDKDFINNYKQLFKDYRDLIYYFQVFLLLFQALIILSFYFEIIRNTIKFILSIAIGLLIIKVSSKIEKLLPNKIFFFVFYLVSPEVIRNKEKFDKLKEIISSLLTLFGISLILLSPLILVNKESLFVTISSLEFGFVLTFPILYALMLEKNLFL